jgi:hypothetical protein
MDTLIIATLIVLLGVAIFVILFQAIRGAYNEAIIELLESQLAEEESCTCSGGSCGCTCEKGEDKKE